MHKEDETPEQETPKTRKRSWQQLFRIIAFFGGFVILACAVYVFYIYATSPPTIRKPAFQHYHLRIQAVVGGKAVNFAEQKYQKNYQKDQCNAVLAAEPFHFHDKKNHMVHVHWDGMTGGQLLKFYGWDHIGGPNGALGYRFDDMPRFKKVSIHGSVLPEIPTSAQFYVYSGDENDYKKRSFEEFLKQDFETFFDQKSNVPDANKETTLMDKFFPKAYAHNGEDHGTNASDNNLKKLNNLIGNVVIFIQKDSPTNDQVKNQFQRLEPLSKSTCAG